MTKLTKKRDGEKSPERLFSKDYILLMGAMLGQSLTNNFFMVVMPLYVAKLGGVTLHAGMVTSAYVFGALLVRPIAGLLSDKYGRMKLMIIGLLVSTVTGAFYGVASVIPLLIFIRAINGIGFGVASTCSGAAVADVLPKTRLAEGIGYFGLSNTVGQALGPGIALAIVAGDTLADYRTLFFVSVGMCVAAAVCACCVSYERREGKQARANQEPPVASGEKVSETEDGKPPQKTVFGFEYAVLAPVAVMLLLYVGIGGIISFLTPFARWRGIENPGLYYISSSVGMVISRLCFARVSDKRGSDVLIIPGMAVLIAGLALLSYVKSMTALIALALPLGLAQGAVTPTLNSMIMRRCSPARRGSASGAIFVAIDGGLAIGAPLHGALADARDYRYIFWAGAIFVVMALMLYLLIASDRRHSRRQARDASI